MGWRVAALSKQVIVISSLYFKFQHMWLLVNTLLVAEYQLMAAVKIAH